MLFPRYDDIWRLSGIALTDGTQVMAIGIAMPIVCLIIVSLRFLTRAMQRIRIGIDDWLSLASLITIIGMGACLIEGAAKQALGWPTPEGSASVDNPLTYVDPISVLVLQLQFAFQVILMLSYGSTKLSIIAFYRRIFVSHRNTPFDIAAKVLGTVTFLWTICFMLIDIFACGLHVTANWGPLSEQLEHCPIGYTSEYGFVISDLILDFALIILPLPVIWKLHMTAMRKLALSAVMLLGVSSIAASIVRMAIYIVTLNATTDGAYVDTNLAVVTLLWWSMLESGLALIAACLPTLSYLVSRVSLQTLISSVRDVLSLHSYTSHQASRVPSKTRLQTVTKYDTRSSKDSVSRIHPGTTSLLEAHSIELGEPIESISRIN